MSELPPGVAGTIGRRGVGSSEETRLRALHDKAVADRRYLDAYLEAWSRSNG